MKIFSKLRDHVIPPILLLITVILQIMSYFIQFPKFSNITGILATIAGLALAIASLLTLKLGGTPYQQRLKPTKLITTGVFAFSRNPVYLGMLILLIGTAILTNTYIASMATLLFYYIINTYYIPHEEIVCREIFKEELDAYMMRTPK